VQAKVQPSEATDSCITTSTQTLNKPDVLNGYWDIDFSDDPTEDYNGDGIDDMKVRTNGTFNTGSLSNGIWNVNCTLDTNPPNDFSSLTVVETRMRAKTVGTPGAAIWINADWTNTTMTPIFLYCELRSDSTQVLSLMNKKPDLTKVYLTTVNNLPNDFIAVRLLIDPDLNTVNLQVNGDDRGTFTYHEVPHHNNDRYISLTESGAAGAFDHLTVEVHE
jgi:hypothetical protein